ncbi:MAG: hypothetical protein SWH54_09765 [Thermodesulfobacteriota bacterium]|nr:hypothetical protein [Thermodesulfobacteriota bacterium]
MSEHIRSSWQEKIMAMIERISIRFMWFIAGAFFGYLWMARAYGLF